MKMLDDEATKPWKPASGIHHLIALRQEHALLEGQPCITIGRYWGYWPLLGQCYSKFCRVAFPNTEKNKFWKDYGGCIGINGIWSWIQHQPCRPWMFLYNMSMYKHLCYKEILHKQTKNSVVAQCMTTKKGIMFCSGLHTSKGLDTTMTRSRPIVSQFGKYVTTGTCKNGEQKLTRSYFYKSGLASKNKSLEWMHSNYH